MKNRDLQEKRIIYFLVKSALMVAIYGYCLPTQAADAGGSAPAKPLKKPLNVVKKSQKAALLLADKADESKDAAAGAGGQPTKVPTAGGSAHAKSLKKPLVVVKKNQKPAPLSADEADESQGAAGAGADAKAATKRKASRSPTRRSKSPPPASADGAAADGDIVAPLLKPIKAVAAKKASAAAVEGSAAAADGAAAPAAAMLPRKKPKANPDEANPDEAKAAKGRVAHRQKLAASGVSGAANEAIKLPANVTVNGVSYRKGKPAAGSGVISYWFKRDGDRSTHHFTIGIRLDDLFQFHITEKDGKMKHQYIYNIAEKSLTSKSKGGNSGAWYGEALAFIEFLTAAGAFS